MKKLSLSAIIISTVLVSTFAVAGNHTILLGYAQTGVEKFSDLKGLEAKYHYEKVTSPFGIIFAAGWGKGNKQFKGGEYYAKGDLSRVTFTSGPAYRFNEFFSLYGVGGISANKYTFSSRYYHGSSSTKAFAFGLGALFNPHENLVVDMSYLAGKTVEQRDTQGLTLSAGYRF